MQKTALSGVSLGAIISGIATHIAFTSHNLLSYEMALMLTAFPGIVHSGFLVAAFNIYPMRWVKLLIITAFAALLFRVGDFLQTYQPGNFSLYFFYGTLFMFLIGLVLTIVAYVMPASSEQH